MVATPFAMAMLLEILETKADAFWRMSSIVGQLLMRLENAQITEENFGVAVGNLGELQREADRLNLRSAVSQLQSIHDHLFEDRKTLVSVRPLVHDLHLRMGNGFARAVGLLPTYNSRLLLLGIRPRTALGVWQA